MKSKINLKYTTWFLINWRKQDTVFPTNFLEILKIQCRTSLVQYNNSLSMLNLVLRIIMHNVKFDALWSHILHNQVRICVYDSRAFSLWLSLKRIENFWPLNAQVLQEGKLHCSNGVTGTCTQQVTALMCSSYSCDSTLRFSACNMEKD